jgi:hypothetical protein
MMLESSAVLYLKSTTLLYSTSHSIVVISDVCASGLLIPYSLVRRRRRACKDYMLNGMDGRAKISILEDTGTDVKEIDPAHLGQSSSARLLCQRTRQPLRLGWEVDMCICWVTVFSGAISA